MILHIDMDAFFASIEQRDNPDLKNKPVIVSGNSKRSVVSTASYEARRFGIGSAMPVFQAKQRCSHLIIVQGNMKKYQADSEKIMNILSGFSPLVEKVSIDEAYVDIKGCERLFGSFQNIGQAIKQNIYEKLSLTCSVGIAPVKFLAKIASDMDKPDGMTIIPESRVKEFILQIPIQKVPGVGKNAMKTMRSLQIKTLGDINQYMLPVLNKKLGKMGEKLFELANGIDTSKVKKTHKKKSISSETTLAEDIYDFEQIKQLILDRSQIVGRDLRKNNLLCNNVFIKLKFSDFTQITRTRKTPESICSSSAIFNQALALFKKVHLKKKIRLVGVGVSDLKDKGDPFQMQLIPDMDRQKQQWESVDSAVDAISEKFGADLVNRASLNKFTHNKKPDMKQ